MYIPFNFYTDSVLGYLYANLPSCVTHLQDWTPDNPLAADCFPNWTRTFPLLDFYANWTSGLIKLLDELFIATSIY